MWHKTQDDGVWQALDSPGWNDLVKGILVFMGKDQVSISCNIHQLRYAKKRKEKMLTGQLLLSLSLQVFNWWPWQNQSIRKQEYIVLRPNMKSVSCSVSSPANIHMIQITKTDHGTNSHSHFPYLIRVGNPVDSHPWNWLGLESAYQPFPL